MVERFVGLYIFNPEIRGPEDVRLKHFKDARVDSLDLEPDEKYQYQKWYARKLYRIWLHDMRHIPGYHNFRRTKTRTSDDDKKLEKILQQQDMVSLHPNLRPKKIRIRPTRLFTERTGSYIATCRRFRKLTQEKLAELIGTDPATVRNIEIGGLITFHEDLAQKIAQTLDIPYQILLDLQKLDQELRA
jgi:ribosome-binding protein aMBF1 (putative translation factor)